MTAFAGKVAWMTGAGTGIVALMPRRTSVPEMLIYPTNVRPYTPAESGRPRQPSRPPPVECLTPRREVSPPC
jgi:hypothetical protein